MDCESRRVESNELGVKKGSLYMRKARICLSRYITRKSKAYLACVAGVRREEPVKRGRVERAERASMLYPSAFILTLSLPFYGLSCTQAKAHSYSSSYYNNAVSNPLIFSINLSEPRQAVRAPRRERVHEIPFER